MAEYGIELIDHAYHLAILEFKCGYLNLIKEIVFVYLLTILGFKGW